jgi:hypothetical protein
MEQRSPYSKGKNAKIRALLCDEMWKRRNKAALFLAMLQCGCPHGTEVQNRFRNVQADSYIFKSSRTGKASIDYDSPSPTECAGRHGH